MATQSQSQPKSMRNFYILWAGQFISTLGSSLTRFAIGLWLFGETESVTIFALSNFFSLVPAALLSPFAGALVDRVDRRTVIIISDTVQALATLGLALLIGLGRLEIAYIYLMIGIMSAVSAFQSPAWRASIPLIVPKDQLVRASGIGRTGSAIARLAAPASAGALVLILGMGAVVLIDFVTYLFALATLLLIPIPNPPRHEEGRKRNFLQDVVFGWRYLLDRRGLFTFILMISVLNLFVNFATRLTVPMTLTLTNEAVVGVIMSIVISGMLLGALIMSTWGGPKRRMGFLLGSIMTQGFFLIVTGLRPSLILITAARFVTMMCFAFINTLIGPILQTKVALEVQGRVFATVTFLALLLEPIGHLTVGPIVDYIFEPLMAEGGALASVLGPMIGVGAGRGMAVIFLLMGTLVMLLGLYGFLNPRVSHLEEELPDALPEEESEAEVVAEPTT